MLKEADCQKQVDKTTDKPQGQVEWRIALLVLNEAETKLLMRVWIWNLHLFLIRDTRFKGKEWKVS